jgi:hypothetical protein
LKTNLANMTPQRAKLEIKLANATCKKQSRKQNWLT